MPNDQVLFEFKLKPGERHYFEYKEVHYTIGVDLFAKHDHEKRPLYYYPIPISEEDPDLFVVWIEDDAKDEYAYHSPDAGSIKGSLFICRFNVDVACTKQEEAVYTSVYEANKQTRKDFSERMKSDSHFGHS